MQPLLDIHFEWENIVEKLNNFEQIVLDTIIKLQKQKQNNKRPDVETIFKDIERNAATYWTLKDEEDNTDLLIASRKLENWPTAKVLDSFFILEKTEKFQMIHLVLNWYMETQHLSLWKVLNSAMMLTNT